MFRCVRSFLPLSGATERFNCFLSHRCFLKRVKNQTPPLPWPLIPSERRRGSPSLITPPPSWSQWVFTGFFVSSLQRPLFFPPSLVVSLFPCCYHHFCSSSLPRGPVARAFQTLPRPPMILLLGDLTPHAPPFRRARKSHAAGLSARRAVLGVGEAPQAAF